MNVQGQWYLPPATAYAPATAAQQPGASAATAAAMMSAAQAAAAAQQQLPQASPYAAAAAVPQGYPQADSAKFMSVGMGLPGFGMGGQAPPPALPQGQSGQAFLGNPGTAAAAFYQAAGLAALSGLHPSALLAAAASATPPPAGPPPMGQQQAQAALQAQAAAAAAAAAASQQAGVRQLLGGCGGGGNGFSVFSKLPLLKTPAGSHHISPLKVRRQEVIDSGLR